MGIEIRTTTTNHASELGAWSFSYGVPAGPLAALIQSFWEVKGFYQHSSERVLPSDNIAVMVNLGPPQLLLGADGRAREFADAWASGLQLEPLTISSPAGSWLCGMRLTPEGAYRTLGVDPADTTGGVIELRDLVGQATDALAGPLRDTPTVEARFHRFAAFVVDRADRALAWDPAVGYALGALSATHGGLPIEEVARRIGWSRQRLHANFRNYVGVTPKSMARLFRFRRAVELIGFETNVDFAQTAHGAGYFDQAHFNRDFRRLAGVTPGDYVRLRITDGEVGFAAVD